MRLLISILFALAANAVHAEGEGCFAAGHQHGRHHGQTASCPRLSADRPITQHYRLEIGGGIARSTYLSPLRYDGRVFGISGEWTKAFNHSPEHIIMQFEADAHLRDYLNPARTATMMGMDGMFAWGLQWRKRLPHSLQFTTGGSVDITGGALYLPRNGNNPANAYASASLDINASISWRFQIGKLPMILMDQLRVPSIGCFFSPQFGETYYEIWLGNHKGLAHCGWWSNNFRINNLLSLKLDFRKTAMEIGYRYDYRSLYASHLSTSLSTHSFMIGIIPYGLGLKRKQQLNSSLY